MMILLDGSEPKFIPKNACPLQLANELLDMIDSVRDSGSHDVNNFLVSRLHFRSFIFSLFNVTNVLFFSDKFANFDSF